MINSLLYNWANYFNSRQGQKYLCGNQIVTYIYITNSPQEVCDYLNKNNISPTIKSMTRIEQQENDERWIWIPITEKIRGYRFYKVKISKNYSNEKILEQVIIPCCNLYCCSWEVIE